MLPTRRPLSDPSRGLSGSRSLPGLRHRGKPSSRAERWVLPDAPPPVSPSSSLPSLEEARSPAHDEALVGFVREAVGLSAPEALALAVRVAEDPFTKVKKMIKVREEECSHFSSVFSSRVKLLRKGECTIGDVRQGFTAVVILFFVLNFLK